MSTAPHLLGSELRGDDFVLVEWSDNGETSSAERPIAPLHVHDRDDEAWYVLEGTLGFRVGDEIVEAPSGAAVLVPAGMPHSFWNARSAPARYVLVMTPRIAALVAAIHDPGARDDLDALFHRFDSRLVH
jgi:mannose-6-phosphate isomerase-like protein (cupin superfamily)